MEFDIFTLPNGIRVIHQPTPKASIAHCGFIIDVGSRDEAEEEHGMAHLIEHAIFKGTRKRKAFHILNRLDVVGGEVNAYTTKENTCVYASFLIQHFERALDLLSDIVFHSTFPAKEVVKEKEVIIDEIHSYLDSPAEQIFDDFEEQVFRGHAIGRGILGTEAHLRQLPDSAVQRFFRKHYTTGNMVFSVVGDISSKKLRRLLQKYLGDLMPGPASNGRVPFSHYKVEDKATPLPVHQSHRMLGNLAYPAGAEKRTAMILLNNILGGPGMNSRLNLNIRERYGFAYNIESNYTAYSDTGIFSIYLGTDQQHLNRSTQLVMKELRQLRETPLGTVQLHNAKQQLIGQIALAQESRSSLMLSIGKSLLLFNKVDTIEEIYRRIDRITAAELQEIAQEVFAADRLNALTYLPKPS